MKKKTLFSLAFILLLVYAALAQTYVTQVKSLDTKKWGYVNQSGELIIPAQYEKCYKFSSEGLAPIYDTKQKQYYFINLKGEKLKTEISSFKLIDGFGFDVEGFKSGLIPVKVGEKWGYLASDGHVAIPAKYDDATDFGGDYTVVKSGTKYLVLNTQGEEFPVEGSGLLDVKHFSEDLAPFRAADKSFGFIGTDGKIAIPAKFESVGYFHAGLAWAKTKDALGYINGQGEWVIKPQFDAGKDFDSESGLARIKKDGQWAYVTKTGELVYVKDTDLWGDFVNGLAVGRNSENVGFYNPSGEWVIKPQFEAARDFNNGFAAAKKGGKWGVIDTSGSWVIEPQYDGIRDMELVK